MRSPGIPIGLDMVGQLSWICRRLRSVEGFDRIGIFLVEDLSLESTRREGVAGRLRIRHWVLSGGCGSTSIGSELLNKHEKLVVASKRRMPGLYVGGRLS